MFVAICLHTGTDLVARKRSRLHTHTQTLMSNQFLSSDSCHTTMYHDEHNPCDAYVLDSVIACHFLSLPLSIPTVSSLGYHVNKARFSPSKGNIQQLPVGGDRAERQLERQKGKMDGKGDKRGLCRGAEQGKDEMILGQG